MRAWLVAALLAGGCSSEPAADLVLLNGRLHTLEPGQPTAEALAIGGDRILLVGTDEQARQLVEEETSVVDLAGRTVVPGLTDAHAHLSGVGFREMQLNLEGADSLEELLARVAGRTGSTPAGDWIVGRGWIESQWDPPKFPTARDLDRVAPDHPVWLVRADGHAGVANSAALRLAGVDRNTPDPPGGQILKDGSGNPTGMLIDRAQELIGRRLPEETPEQLREALIRGATRYAQLGWTQIQIAGAGWDEIEALRELQAAGRIPIRVYAAVRGPGPPAEKLLERGPQTENPSLTVRSIKLVLDGALGSGGAALLEPYADRPGRGLLLHEPAALEPLLAEALRRGIQIESHAIGDRANRLALDLYERAFAAVPPAERAVVEPRWRIEHAQILDPADLPRFGKLGIIASMQPSHAITDLHFAKSRLGAARLESGGYAWRALLDSGAVLAGGSDAPVERGDPMIEFYAAVVRKDLDGFSADHWGREQRLTRREALEALTRGPAFAAFQEDVRGTLAPGKWADLTVLSADPLEAPEQELPQIRAEMTIVAGKVVYER